MRAQLAWQTAIIIYALCCQMDTVGTSNVQAIDLITERNIVNQGSSTSTPDTEDVKLWATVGDAPVGFVEREMVAVSREEQEAAVAAASEFCGSGVGGSVTPAIMSRCDVPQISMDEGPVYVVSMEDVEVLLDPKVKSTGQVYVLVSRESHDVCGFFAMSNTGDWDVDQEKLQADSLTSGSTLFDFGRFGAASAKPSRSFSNVVSSAVHLGLPLRSCKWIIGRYASREARQVVGNLESPRVVTISDNVWCVSSLNCRLEAVSEGMRNVHTIISDSEDGLFPVFESR